MKFLQKLFFTCSPVVNAVILFVIIVFSALPAAARQMSALESLDEAAALSEKREYLQAVDSYRMALRLNPDFLEASLGLGEALNKTGAAREALEIFDSTIVRYPSEVRAVIGRANAHYQLGNLQQALDDYETAEKLEANLTEARFGIALVYEAMGKDEWAQRAVDSLLKSDPYHYDTLLLSARLLIKKKRLEEAEKLLRKAIHSEQDLPQGYMEYGKLFYQKYLQSGDPTLIIDAREQLGRAVLIQPSLYEAYVVGAGFDLLQNDYSSADQKLLSAQSFAPSDISVNYNLACVRERLGDISGAGMYYKNALTAFADMPLLIGKYENYLVDNEYRFGSPERKYYSDYHYDLYKRYAADNLPDYALMHLRLALLMDPLAVNARQNLAEYYKILGYNSFYISQLKNIERMEPSQKNRDELNRAVIARRDLLYSREGYALKDPPRDVVRIAVVPFESIPDPFTYFDAGSVVARNLLFALEQYGRHQSYFSETLPSASSSDAEFVLSGEMEYNPSRIEVRYVLRDMKGARLASFSLYESGKDYLNRINYRAAARIYKILPVRGRILKESLGDVVVNVGSWDGLGKGDLLYTYDYAPDRRRRKILLEVTETDTLLAAASVKNPRFAGRISKGEPVYGLERRRAELIK